MSTELTDVQNMLPGDMFIDRLLKDVALVLARTSPDDLQFKVYTLLNPDDYRDDARIEQVGVSVLNQLSSYVKAERQ